jgi:hypothetical protein
MRTLDVTRLSDEDLGRLCTLEQMNWGVVNESVGRCLIESRQEHSRVQQRNGELEKNERDQQREIGNLRKAAEQQEREVEDLRTKIAEEQSERVVMKAVIDEQQRKIGELEGESHRQEGMIVRQASEIEGVKTVMKECEDELKRSTETNEAQGRELGQLKEENKAAKVNEDRLKEEVGKLKEEIRRMAAQHDSLVKELAEVKGLLNPLGMKKFPPLVKKGSSFDVPDGIIAHLTRECGGNVHDRHVVDVTCGSFEDEIKGANPHSGAYDNRADCCAKNVADMGSGSSFRSAYRKREENIPHTRNNWVSYDFKERRIMPTHYAIRTHERGPGWENLKSWLIETSTDGESWREVDHKEDNKQLNGPFRTGIFMIPGGEKCRFIRLVNIGRNHRGDDIFQISAWEIFGSLIE